MRLGIEFRLAATAPERLEGSNSEIFFALQGFHRLTVRWLAVPRSLSVLGLSILAGADPCLNNRDLRWPDGLLSLVACCFSCLYDAGGFRFSFGELCPIA